jgi:hypothetical protein
MRMRTLYNSAGDSDQGNAQKQGVINMALRMIPMVLLCTCLLQGCFMMFPVCNPDAACQPLPEFSAENHDGVCPDITGIYAVYAKDEYSAYSNLQTLEFRFLGKLQIKLHWELAKELKIKPAIPAELSASFSELVHIHTSDIVASFRRIGDNLLERIGVDDDGMLRSVIHLDTSPEYRACDKGRAFYQLNLRSTSDYGMSGDMKFIRIISKDSTGDVIQQEYRYRNEDLNLNPLSLLQNLIATETHNLKLYRFKKLSDTPIMLPEGFVFPE